MEITHPVTVTQIQKKFLLARSDQYYILYLIWEESKLTYIYTNKEIIQNTTSEIKRELHKGMNCKYCGGCEWGRVGDINRSRTGVRRCETTLKKLNIFEKKKYTNCEWGGTQRINHLLQCSWWSLLVKKTTSTRKTTKRSSSQGFSNDYEKEKRWSRPIPFKHYRYHADNIV